jgi:hypothetical protein
MSKTKTTKSRGSSVFPGQRRSFVVAIRLTADEMRQLRAVADGWGVGLGTIGRKLVSDFLAASAAQQTEG